MYIFFLTKHINMFIISDPRIKLITTTRYNTSYFQTKPGSFISWRVDVDSLVVPYLEW